MHVTGRQVSDGRAAFPTRRAYLVLGLGFAAFAVYGSLVPFELHPISLEAAWDQFRTLLTQYPTRRISRSDFLANILLFVPVGFTLAGGLLLDRERRFALVLAALLILPFSLVVSSVAEFLQTFTDGRVPSSTDIAAQTAGCLVGIALWGVVGTPLTRWLRDAFAAAPEDRLSRLLVAYAAGWVFVSLAPFDITVDLGDLARRVRTGKITLVPFAGVDVFSARGAWDALAEVLSATPLGALGLVVWRWSRGMAFASGVLLVMLVEGAQIFIRSHAASATDLLFGSVGVALGASVIGSRLRHGELTRRPGDRSAINVAAFAAIGFWCLVLCAYHWAPYDFALDNDQIRRKLARMSLVPFAGYRSGSDLNAFSNLLTKLALSAPLGVAAAFAFASVFSHRWIRLALALTLAGLALGAIEIGQMFLPDRVPDPTDVLVGVIGSYGGCRLAAWLKPGAAGLSGGLPASYQNAEPRGAEEEQRGGFGQL